MKVRVIRKARIAPGKREEAIEFAAMISDHYTEKLDAPTSWGLEVGGEPAWSAGSASTTAWARSRR